MATNNTTTAMGGGGGGVVHVCFVFVCVNGRASVRERAGEGGRGVRLSETMHEWMDGWVDLYLHEREGGGRPRAGEVPMTACSKGRKV
mmetsp:Transcript_8516/g.24310  ORF Transcript_8516/g.24310 Transcript_8516/m.24310 type:complete len:88 (+) Transcript_8516:90-353(+)